MAQDSSIAAHAELLAHVELFAGLSRLTLAKLAAHLVPVDLAAGEELFGQGDPGDAFYLVTAGEIGVYVGSVGDGETRVAVLGAGDPVGEMALLTNSPRSASIRAESDGQLLRLDRGRFLRLVREEPDVLLAIASTLSRRLQATLAAGNWALAEDNADVVSAAEAPQPPPSLGRIRRRLRPNRSATGALLALIILVFGWLVAPPTGLSAAGWHALVLLGAAVPILAVEALPDGILALLLCVAWVLGGVARPEVAFVGFSSASWILVVSVLAVGAAIAASGVLYRLALWMVAHTKGGFAGQVAALSLGGVLMGPAVPNATGRVTMIAPALRELVEALGYAPRSPAAVGLAMTALMGFGQMAAVFLTSSTTAVLVYAVLPAETRGGLDWLAWAYYAAPPHLMLLLGVIAMILWKHRPVGGREDNDSRRKLLDLQRALLGRASRREQISVAVGVALVIGFVAQPLHGLNPAWVAVLALAVLAATGVATAVTLRDVNWSFALLFGMLAGISDVFSRTKVDQWLAHALVGALGGLADTPALFILVLTLLCFAVSFVLRWQAAAPLVTIALAPVAAAKGISPLVVGLVALIACNTFFLPYQSTTYLALYHGTGGEVFTHQQARPTAVAYGIFTLIALVASVFLWRMMGLM